MHFHFYFHFHFQIAISIADYAAISPRFALAGAAILTASLLGWLMPLVANIVPIQVNARVLTVVRRWFGQTMNGHQPWAL